MELYLYLNGSKRGPFTRESVQRYLNSGLLQASDLAAEGMSGDLKPLSTFDLLGPATLPAAPAFVRPAPPSDPPAAGATMVDLPRIPLNTLGPYARSTLAPNETPFFKTTLHWIIFVRFGLLGLVLFFFAAMPFAIAVQALTASQLGWFALPLPIFILLPPTLAYVSSELVITDRRVLIKTGIIRRQTIEMFISKIESIAVDQSVLGRLLDYGTVLIRGTGGFQEPFEAIANPVQFRNSVQRLQSAHSVAAPAVS